MEYILFLDVVTLIGALFWCSLTAAMFLIGYLSKCRNSYEKRIVALLLAAKFSHAIAYICFLGRGALSDLLSVHVGNSVFLVGFYLEAQVILLIIRERSLGTLLALRILFAVSLALFNVIGFLLPMGGMRVAAASISIVLIMILPNIKMLFSRDSSLFAKTTSVMYMVLILLLLPRAWYGVVHQDVGILTNTALQSLTFEALLLLLLFSIPAYILIEKEYTENALVVMATTDKVTGATNRHAFMEAATVVYEEHIRLKLPMSVLFIDIDHFKAVNDRYGHPFGDTVLVRLAGVIDYCLRGSDLSCRYGGEEFVILLVHAELNTARLVGNRIMQEISKLHFDEQPDFSFTVSIGVYSGTPERSQTLETFINYADHAMYEAKNANRNRIVVYVEKPPLTPDMLASVEDE